MLGNRLLGTVVTFCQGSANSAHCRAVPSADSPPTLHGCSARPAVMCRATHRAHDVADVRGTRCRHCKAVPSACSAGQPGCSADHLLRWQRCHMLWLLRRTLLALRMARTLRTCGCRRRHCRHTSLLMQSILFHRHL